MVAIKHSLPVSSQRLLLATAVYILVASCIGVGARPSPSPKPSDSPSAKAEDTLATVPTTTPTPTTTTTPTPASVPTTTPTPATKPGPEGILVTGDGRASEQNVCDEGGTCGLSARVEVEVRSKDSDNTTFAPLCAPDSLNETERWALARIICNQHYNWPKAEEWRTNPNGLMSVMGFVEAPVLIPTKVAKGAKGTDGSALFNPSSYKYWVTISGWGKTPPESVRLVQELSLKVSRSPCSKGRMLAVYCTGIVADHRRHMLRA